MTQGGSRRSSGRYSSRNHNGGVELFWGLVIERIGSRHLTRYPALWVRTVTGSNCKTPVTLFIASSSDDAAVTNQETTTFTINTLHSILSHRFPPPFGFHLFGPGFPLLLLIPTLFLLHCYYCCHYCWRTPKSRFRSHSQPFRPPESPKASLQPWWSILMLAFGRDP